MIHNVNGAWMVLDHVIMDIKLIKRHLASENEDFEVSVVAWTL